MEPNNSLVVINMTGATKQATLHRLARTVQAMGGSGVIFDLPTHRDCGISTADETDDICTPVYHMNPQESAL
jgi:uncharacterized protein (UPF0261 family)